MTDSGGYSTFGAPVSIWGSMAVDVGLRINYSVGGNFCLYIGGEGGQSNPHPSFCLINQAIPPSVHPFVYTSFHPPVVCLPACLDVIEPPAANGKLAL